MRPNPLLPCTDFPLDPDYANVAPFDRPPRRHRDRSQHSLSSSEVTVRNKFDELHYVLDYLTILLDQSTVIKSVDASPASFDFCLGFTFRQSQHCKKISTLRSSRRVSSRAAANRTVQPSCFVTYGEVVEISDEEDYSVPSDHDLPIIPKDEGLDYNFPPQITCPRPAVEDVASSSGINLRASFIGMGFAPSLVDKAMEENGEENAESLLETLFAYSDHQQLKTEESFDDGLSSRSSNDLTVNHNVKEEPDAGSSVNDGKKASLLKMNFSLAEVDFAMDRLGKDAAVGQLMDFVFAARMAKKYEKDGSNIFPGDEDCSDEAIFGSEASPQELADSIFDPDAHKNRPPKRKIQPFDSIYIKTEEYIDVPSQVGPSDSLERSRGKMPKAQRIDGPSIFKKPKDEFAEDTSSPIGRARPEARKGNSSLSGGRMTAWQKMVDELGSLEDDRKPTVMPIPNNPSRTLTGMVAKPPYFLYEPKAMCITSLSKTDERNIPSLRKAQKSVGPPPEQQRELIQQLQAKNLVWVGRNKLGPLEPEQIEVIMGYPLHHTRVAGFGVSERLKSLKLAFQTDTLGYHLSVLKKLYPEGLTVMSCFDGIGGAEVALHRLGIRLKGLVSVETNEMKRKIVKKWWESSGQSGELVQIESIHKLSSSKLEELIKRFRGFDLIVCQNPYCSEDSSIMSGLDFSMFVEFVRVLQRVRSSR
ncbi:DNA (cytosine-5)-methyltransferase drm2 [Phtheirospermum japonicum]|uniref:DNA (Cytosine-5)-methyltransferase drm2 n=1 Tax=Phtheirospermum japonicum TaxID=374723 RepID=A0A830BM14_9LAMI|nr:DNA (cytosine-5)-methyltransferase drm2 [Phtheirospermum japonicum]